MFAYKKLLFSFIIILFAKISFSQTSIRFMGNGVNAPDADRIKILVDNVSNSNPGPAIDIGSSDFTIEFWIKASASNNTSQNVSCGTNINWIYGNIIIDRDRYNQDRKYGISVAGGQLVFGVSGNGTGDMTLCSTSNVLDNMWHHIAVQRRISDGQLWLFVDGVMEASGDGPDGDISYPDNGIPCTTCCNGGNCNGSDPYIVLGAEKHDAGAQFPSYNGQMDELRFSNILRYTTNFTPPTMEFEADSNTVGLFHFNEGSGTVLNDFSNTNTPDGTIIYGGTPNGPVWVNDSPLSTLSIPDFNIEDMIAIYPNPTKGKITIDKQDTVIELLTFYTIGGVKIMSLNKNNFKNLPEQLHIRLDSLSPGIYLLVITTNTATFYKKLIKV